MLTGPREIDLWKKAWRDQVSKAARSVHPLSIKVKCLLEMKKCLSPTTWHWVQNYYTLEGHRDDPDAILKALQGHAHKTANVQGLPDTGANIHMLPDRIGRQFARYCEIVFPRASTHSRLLACVRRTSSWVARPSRTCCGAPPSQRRSC